MKDEGGGIANDIVLYYGVQCNLSIKRTSKAGIEVFTAVTEESCLLGYIVQ
jgi:hypothetical protein